MKPMVPIFDGKKPAFFRSASFRQPHPGALGIDFIGRGLVRLLYLCKPHHTTSRKVLNLQFSKFLPSMRMCWIFFDEEYVEPTGF